MLEVSMHWLSYTIPETIRIEETINTINTYVPSEYIPLPGGMMGYENQVQGAGGSRILFSRERPEHHVILPGMWCEAAGLANAEVLCRQIIENGGHFTRIDLAGDDFERKYPLALIAEKSKTDELVTRFKTIDDKKSIRGDGGHTIMYGSPRSERRLRIYDKLIREQRQDSVLQMGDTNER